jgi:PKD domain
MRRPTLRITLALLAAALLAACVPAAANAAGDLFCVHPQGTSANCIGGSDKLDDLQAALTAAGLDPTSANNTVNIAAGTYTPKSPNTQFTYTSGLNNSVTITGTGSGNNATQINGVAGSTPAVLNVDPGSGTATVSGLSIKVVSTTTGGAVLKNATTSNVAVALPASSSGTALTLTDSPLTDSSVTVSTPLGNSRGIEASGASNLLRDTVTAQNPLDTNNANNLTATNLRLTGTGFLANIGNTSTVSIFDSLLTQSSNATQTQAMQVAGGSTLTGRNLTIVKGGSTTTGLIVTGNGGLTSTANITDSIFSGFGADLSRTVDTGGTANATFDHDITNAVADPSPGVQGNYAPSNNVNANPLFVDPTHADYRLRVGSPAIDTGSPCAGSCLTTPDITLHARPVNGALDRGAIEYLRQPPTVTAIASEESRFLGAGSTFTAAGTDPDADPLTYTWVFDDGGTANGQLVGHTFSTIGPHTATVTATDPTGLTATSTATTIIVGATMPQPQPQSPPDTTPPTISNLSLNHTSFAVSSKATAISAKAKKKKAPPPPRGTKILFSLSEPATVSIDFTFELSGVTVHGKCVAKSSAHKKGKACTKFIDQGTITRTNLAAGVQAIAFSGRIGPKVLAKGKYHLTASAVDAAGNRSRNDKKLSFKVV